MLPDLFAPVVRPSVPAVDLFDTYGKRSRAPASGRAPDETLAEWEAAMQLDPSNRSYAVNVQKLRLKLQR
jgi:hypothetical protein